MSDEQDGTPTEPTETPADDAGHPEASDPSEAIAAAPEAPATEPLPPVAQGAAPPPPPPAPSAMAASGWSKPSGLPVLTLALGALLIGVLAFGVGVFAGRSSAEASGRDGRGWMQGGDQGGMRPGAGGSIVPGMPGVALPGNGSAPFPGMPGIGAGGNAVPGNWAVTAGTVVSVDGDTIVVQSVKGNTVTVHTTDATAIRIVRDQGQDGSDDVAKGDDIVAAGTPGEGELTIDAVQVVAGDLPWIRSIEQGGSASGGSNANGSGTTGSAEATAN